MFPALLHSVACSPQYACADTRHSAVQGTTCLTADAARGVANPPSDPKLPDATPEPEASTLTWPAAHLGEHVPVQEDLGQGPSLRVGRLRRADLVDVQRLAVGGHDGDVAGQQAGCQAAHGLRWSGGSTGSASIPAVEPQP